MKKTSLALSALILFSACSFTPKHTNASRSISGSGVVEHLNPTYLAKKVDLTHAPYPYDLINMLPGKKLKDGGKPGDKVVYWDDIEREKHRVIIYQGLVYDSNGDILPDTKSNHEDHNNYVMDAAGNFYLFDEYTHPETRHSSVFAGNPVAGAGDWIIKDGRITYINNDSGHYKPGALFINVIQELNRSGVNTSTCSTSASECRPLIPQ